MMNGSLIEVNSCGYTAMRATLISYNHGGGLLICNGRNGAQIYSIINNRGITCYLLAFSGQTGDGNMIE